jgi:hypothetical protein
MNSRDVVAVLMRMVRLDTNVVSLGGVSIGVGPGVPEPGSVSGSPDPDPEEIGDPIRHVAHYYQLTYHTHART